MKSTWATVVDNELGTLKLEFNSGMAFLHLIFRKPMDGLRVARERFPDVKVILRMLGYRRVHVAIPEGDYALYRFETSFGFRECRRAGGNILMHQEI